MSSFGRKNRNFKVSKDKNTFKYLSFNHVPIILINTDRIQLRPLKQFLIQDPEIVWGWEYRLKQLQH